MGIFRRNKPVVLESAVIVNADTKTSAEIQRDKLKKYFDLYKGRKNAQQRAKKRTRTGTY